MDFIKSLVKPLGMRKYRNMPILVAIAIFLISTYLLVLPVKIKFGNVENVYAVDGYHSSLLYNSTTNFDYANIAASGYQIDAKAQSLLAADVEKKVYTLDCVSGETNYTLYLVFDLENEKYETNEDLYAKYEVQIGKDKYLLLFGKNYYHLEEATESQDEAGATTYTATTSQGASYKYMSLDFTKIANADEFLKVIAYNMADLYGDLYVSSYTLTCFLMMFILPLVLVLFVWLVLKRNGSLKLFKEYYNVASITSIIPVILVFAVSWFAPQIINFYTTAFVLYYLFVIFRINSYPVDYIPKGKIKPAKPVSQVEAEVVEEENK